MSTLSESELAFLSIEQAARLLRQKKLSPVDLVEAALARIERFNPQINSFITVVADRARRDARIAEKRFRTGRVPGILCGIPISLKDNFSTRGVRTTAGSPILSDFVPGEDSDVAAKLTRAGAVLLGKTNMHEFAYGITSENPHFGPARNPWDLDRVTGGSSGGSAAALAVGIGYAATGTDTGGSIRIPSALCGIAGLKPTFGLVSLAGVIPLAKTFDHAGPMARSVTDVCIMLEAMAGYFPRGIVRPDYRKLRKNRPRRFRLGWPKQYFFERIDEEVLKAWNRPRNALNHLAPRLRKFRFPASKIQLSPARALHSQKRRSITSRWDISPRMPENTAKRFAAGLNWGATFARWTT